MPSEYTDQHSTVSEFRRYPCPHGLCPYSLNARRQARLEAAARYERRLEAVGCSALFGADLHTGRAYRPLSTIRCAAGALIPERPLTRVMDNQ